MRRLLIALVLPAASARAQSYTSKVELSLGYSYSYMRVPNSSTRINMNGVVLDATTFAVIARSPEPLFMWA
jgi:hypothetical protein